LRGQPDVLRWRLPTWEFAELRHPAGLPHGSGLRQRGVRSVLDVRGLQH
jgi:hypothetical protein